MTKPTRELKDDFKECPQGCFLCSDCMIKICEEIDKSKEEGVKQGQLSERKEEIKFLQILCMAGGINEVAMKKVFEKIDELKEQIQGGKE
jgi:hypothetical protein